MLLAVWVVLILLGFIYRKSKKLTIVQITYVSLMIAFNNGNPDQYDYMLSFNRIRDSFSNIFSGNILYNILMWIFGIFNNYNIAILLLVFLSLGIMYKGVKYYTDKTSFVFSLYLIAPFTIDATQVKNFVAMAIWIYFSKFLYEAFKREKTAKNILIYVIGVMITSLFHFSFIFAFVYVFIIYVDKKHIHRMILFMGICAAIYFALKNIQYVLPFLNATQISYLRLFVVKYDAYAANYIIERGSTRLITTGIFYLVTFLVFLLQSILENKRENNEKLFREFALKLTIISLFTLPLISVSIEIYRMQRNLLCIYYIMVALQSLPALRIYSGKWLLNSNIISSLFVIGGAIFYMYIETILWNYENVFCVLFRI